jgi:succinate-semialdehyde dehydrogenase / glutarate-semialdehyde dehydrogenase
VRHGGLGIHSTQDLLSRSDLPFRGIKRSGYGKELSNLGLEEFWNKKLVLVPNTSAGTH